MQQKAKAQPDKVPPGQPGTSCASTASTSAPTSNLTPEEIELLKSMKCSDSKESSSSDKPKWGATLEEQKESHRIMEIFCNTPSHLLPPDLLAQRNRLESLHDPLKKLKTAPMKSLPPELQRLKRERAGQCEELDLDEAFGTTDIKRRMSKLLRENREPDFAWDDLGVNPENREKTKVLQDKLQAYTFSLQRRKPKVLAEFIKLIFEYMNADEPVQMLNW